MLKNIIMNGIPMQEDSSMTILDVARKHGVDIPTLCFIKRDDCNFTHKPASCRVCVVEIKGRRNLMPACATYIEEGMEISTNSYKVRQERKNVVELLLSNHPNDCLRCRKSNSCELQALASKLGVNRLEFAGPLSQENKEERHGSLLRNPSKCILCNRCTAICKELQSIGAISASERGFATVISDGYKCINCGQCIQVCPTGALMQYDDTFEIEKQLADPKKYVIVQTAPAVRVSIGEGFGLEPGVDVSKKMITALRYMGFDKVFDTNFGADLTIMEEANELVERLQNGGKLPMITSCCPGWIKFIETQYPELLDLPSSCKSPQEMFSAVAKTYYAKKNNIDPKDMVVVSLMPCTAKKREILRIQERIEGDIQPTDYSMTVKEFISMVKRFGLDIKNLPDGEFDDPLGESTGAADIFAQTGGVMEAAIRTAGSWLDGDAPWNVDWETGYDAGVKEATVKVGGIDLNLCIVSGLANARKVLEKVKSGEKNYHFIEVMACPGGCLNGGGQPIAKDGKYAETVKMRRAGIQAIDKGKSARISCDSPAIKQVYAQFFEKPGSHLAHELLHTSYADEFDKL